MIDQKTLLKYAKTYGFDVVKSKFQWEGYDVYPLDTKKHVDIGLPHFLLAKDGEIRISSPDEHLKLFNYQLSLEDSPEEN